MKKLIINADDFGVHESVNNAVRQAAVTGVLTSATLVPCGQAYESAVDIAAAIPELGVGIHLTLVVERPLCSPENIRTLVDNNGKLFGSYGTFLQRFVRGRIKIQDIERELRAQIEKVLDSNVKPDHLDSHQHLHVFPGIVALVSRLAAEYRIPAVRFPCEPAGFRDKSVGVMRHWARNGLSLVARGTRSTWNNAGLKIPGNFYGMLYGGSMTVGRLQKIIKQLPDGISEIMVHPAVDSTAMNAVYGWNYNWEQELAALCDPAVRNQIVADDIQLVSFSGAFTV